MSKIRAPRQMVGNFSGKYLILHKILMFSNLVHKVKSNR